MSDISRTLRKANDLLSREFGRSSTGLPNLAWGFSDPDLFDWIPGVAKFSFVAPSYDPDGNLIYDHHCVCGVNAVIHSGDCKFSVGKVRLSLQRSGFQYFHVWQLGRWIPPPSEAEWAEIDGTRDNYPAKGRHVQVSINGVEIAVRKDRWPELPTMTAKMIPAFRDDIENKKRRLAEADERMQLRDWTPTRTASGTPDVHYQPGGVKGSKYAELRDQFKQSMTFKGLIPGQKGNVSWGYAPSFESGKPLIEIAKG
jgi:hypothetical protein